MNKALLCLVLFTFILTRTISTSFEKCADELRCLHNLSSTERYNKNDEYRHLRIKFFFDESVENLELEKKRLISEDVVPKAVDFWSKALLVKRLDVPIVLPRSCAAIGGGTCCSKEVCLTATKCGEYVVPYDHLDACWDVNGTECVPDVEEGSGVNDADYILYISAVHTPACDSVHTVAYATHCAQEPVLDRPVAGNANICPSNISSNDRNIKELLSTVKHEILHALGFSVGLYAFYRDSEGKPLTPRDEHGKPPRRAEGPYVTVGQWSNRVIREVTRKWKVRGGYVEKKAYFLVTPKVVREVRKHFNCSHLEGAELEDQGGEGTQLSHWEKRVFGYEVMTGIHTHESVYSQITFALLEDTGWYVANYSMAQPLDWGKHLGCDFCMKSCKEWMDNRKSTEEDIDPFCDSINNHIDQPQLLCTASRESIGYCDLIQHSEPLQKEYQNFDELPGISTSKVEFYGSATELTDYCPFVVGIIWNSTKARSSNCVNSHNKPTDNFILEEYGESSMCLTVGKQNWTVTECDQNGNIKRNVSGLPTAGCYKYSCSEGRLFIELTGKLLPCFYGYQQLPVQILSNRSVYSGTLTCPPCEDICVDEGERCNVDDRNAAKHYQYETHVCSSKASLTIDAVAFIVTFITMQTPKQ